MWVGWNKGWLVWLLVSRASRHSRARSKHLQLRLHLCICVRFLQSICVRIWKYLCENCKSFLGENLKKVFVWELVNIFVPHDTLVPDQNISISLQCIATVFVWALVNCFVSYDTLVPNQNISISLQLRLHLWYLCENCKSIYARIRQSIWVRISYTCCASRQVCSFRLCCDYVPSIFRLCSVYILFLELINKCPIEIVQLLRNLKYFLHGDCEKVRGLNCELLLWISPTCKAGSRSCKAGSVEREGGRGGLCLNSREGRRCQSKWGGRCFDSRHKMQPAQKLSQINFHALLLQRRVRVVHCVSSWNTCVAENTFAEITSQCTAATFH